MDDRPVQTKIDRDEGAASPPSVSRILGEDLGLSVSSGDSSGGVPLLRRDDQRPVPGVLEERGEDALNFVQVREMSPQWEVRLPDGRQLARVTERYLKEPPYVVCFDRCDGLAEEEIALEDRDEVVALLLERMPSEFR
jgi:hypothetical protein